MTKSRLSIHLFATLASILFFILVSPYNLGFSPDSMTYLEVSKNIAAGNGVVLNSGQLLSHWPPLYHILLAYTSVIFGVSTLNAGIYLNTALLYAFLVIFYFILNEFKIKQGVSVFVCFLLLLSQSTLIFGQYLSEGLFMVFLLSCFYFFLKWLNNNRVEYLLVSGLFGGLLLLTRYAGIGFIGGLIIYIIFLKKNIKWKLMIISLFMIPILLIFTPWILYINSFEGVKSIRSFSVHMIGLDKIKTLFITIAYWFLGSFIVQIILLVLIIPSIFLLKKHYETLATQSSNMCLKFRQEILLIFSLSITYIVFLFVSISFFDSYTPLDNRILAPIFPFLLILILLFIRPLSNHTKLRMLYYSVPILLLINFTTTAGSQWINHYKYGVGYMNKIWVESETLQASRLLNNKQVYTNGVEIFNLHTNFDTKILPLNSDKLKLNEIKKEIKNGNTQLIYLTNVNWRNYLIKQEEILKEFEDFDILRLKDGLIIKSQKAIK